MRLSLFALALAAPLLTGALAAAEDGQVVLKAIDGKSWVTGRIVAVDDRFVTMATAFGEMSIIRDAVYCQGHACPLEIVRDPGAGDFVVARVLLQAEPH